MDDLVKVSVVLGSDETVRRRATELERSSVLESGAPGAVTGEHEELN